MNDDNLAGGVLGQLGQTVKQAAKQVVKIPEEMAQDVGKQMTGDENPPTGQKPAEQKSGLPAGQAGFQNDEERKAFLKSLYGPTEPGPNDSSLDQQKTPLRPPQADLEGAGDEEFEKQIADKTPEEQQQLRALRKQLHDQYYQQLVDPVKPQEERPAEKVEQEKKMEALELEEKDKEKPPPLAVQMEQNKAEQFRGASG